MDPLEKSIERTLGLELRALGCLYLKFVSPGNQGVPDRIVIGPDGRVVFLELKRDGGRLSRLQSAQLDRLRRHHADARVLFGIAGAHNFLHWARLEWGR